MISALLFASALASAECPPVQSLETGGDYTNPADRQALSVVENFHFTTPVETLAHGISDSLGSDIGYTLEHFPNHHRALAALAKLALREKSAHPQGARYSVECYFVRAIGYRSADPTVRSIYGIYLLALNHDDEALEQMREACRLEPGNASAHYNLGLLLFKHKDYRAAREHAKSAYALGFPLPGLKNKLVEAHAWNEAPD